MKRYRIRIGSIAWWAVNALKVVGAFALIYVYVVLLSALA